MKLCLDILRSGKPYKIYTIFTNFTSKQHFMNNAKRTQTDSSAQRSQPANQKT